MLLVVAMLLSLTGTVTYAADNAAHCFGWSRHSGCQHG